MTENTDQVRTLSSILEPYTHMYYWCTRDVRARMEKDTFGNNDFSPKLYKSVWQKEEEAEAVLAPLTISIREMVDLGQVGGLQVTNEAGQQVSLDFRKFHRYDEDGFDDVELRNFLFTDYSMQQPSPPEKDSQILEGDDHHHRKNDGEAQTSKVRKGNKFSGWYQPEIRHWAEGIRGNQGKWKNSKAFYLEAMQVVNRVLLLTQGHVLSDNQMMECLSILNCLEEKEDKKKEHNNRKGGKGHLTTRGQGQPQQVLKCEEKSTVITFIALIRALQGDQIEILMKSPILAEREAEKWKKFYEYFDLICGHNGDILYADLAPCQIQYLRDQYGDLGALSGGPSRMAIDVDKMGTMFPDDSSPAGRFPVHDRHEGNTEVMNERIGVTNLEKIGKNSINRTNFIFQGNGDHLMEKEPINSNHVQPIDVKIEQARNWARVLHQLVQKEPMEMMGQSFQESSNIDLTSKRDHIDQRAVCVPPTFLDEENEVCQALQFVEQYMVKEMPNNGRVLIICETMEDDLHLGTFLPREMYEKNLKYWGHENRWVVPTNGITDATNLSGRGTDLNTFEQTKMKTQEIVDSEALAGRFIPILHKSLQNKGPAKDSVSRKEIESFPWTSGNFKHDEHNMIGGLFVVLTYGMVQKPRAPSYHQLNSNERRRSTAQINASSESLVDNKNFFFNSKSRNGHPYFMGEPTRSESKKILSTMKEFEALENLIERDGDARQNFMRQLLREMSKFSSPTLASHVRKGLSALFSLKLASQFNWKGRLGKKSFRWTEIQRILFVAVQTKFFEVTDYEIEKPVKKWFKRVDLMYGEKMKPKGSAKKVPKKMRKQKMGRTAARTHVTAAHTAPRRGRMRSVQRNFGQRRRGGAPIGRKLARTFGGGKYASGKYGKQR